MKPAEKRSNRKALLAASLILSGLVIVQTAATADDAGQADAGPDAGNGTYGPNKSSICSVAPHGLYGTAFGAGCC
jgi:hypothetical protein